MSASTLYWTGGANDSSFMNSANWNTARDGSGSALAPGAGGAGDTLYIENGNQVINGATTGISVLNLFITFGGSVGSAATPLNIAVTGTLTVRTGAQNHYIAAVSAGTIVLADIKQTGTGKVFLAGPGAYTTINWGSNSQVDIGATTAVTTAQGSGGIMTAAANATAFTTLTVAGGQVFTYRGATTANIGGSLTNLGTAAAITTANILPAGRHQNWSSSTVGRSVVYPGGVASSVGSPYQATITDRTTFEGAKNYYEAGNVTFTNAATVVGQQAA